MPTPAATPTSHPHAHAGRRDDPGDRTADGSCGDNRARNPCPPRAGSPTGATPTPTAPVRRGALVDANDPTVTYLPVLVRQSVVAYPEMARLARVEGVVELKALVDENGQVEQR